MIVPHEADLTTNDDAFNSLTADDIDNQSDWDDAVNDDSGKQLYEEAFMRKMTWSLMLIMWMENNHDSTCKKPWW